MNRTVREVTYALLRDLGMTAIFGNPGSNELPFLKDMPSDFQYILALHERSAAGAALGHAIAKQNAAFVNLHSIASAGNGLSAIVDAQLCHIPLVATAGQQDRRHIITEPFLTSHAVDVVKPYVKWAYEPLRAEDVPAAIARGYYLAMQPPRGPVFISIPMDDWNHACPSLQAREVSKSVSPDLTALNTVVTALNASFKLALVAGSQIEEDSAWHEVVALAEHLNADVYEEPVGSRWTFPRSHRLFCGDLPPAQAPLSKQLSAYDTVVVLGAPIFMYHAYVPGDVIKTGTKLFQITNSPWDASTALAGSSIVGNLADAARFLRSHCPAVPPDASSRRAKPPAPKPEYPIGTAFLFHALNQLLPKDAILVEEAPSSNRDLLRYVELNQPGSFYSVRSGILGFAMPLAVGLQMGLPHRRVFSIVGDGSAQYSIQALWTAVQYKAPVIFMVLNNGDYSALKGFCIPTNLGKGLPGLSIPGIDIVKISEGYGMPAHLVNRPEEFEPALRKALGSSGPSLLSVNIQNGVDAYMGIDQSVSLPNYG